MQLFMVAITSLILLPLLVGL